MIIWKFIKDHKHQRVLEIAKRFNHNFTKKMEMICWLLRCKKELKTSKKSMKLLILNIHAPKKSDYLIKLSTFDSFANCFNKS